MLNSRSFLSTSTTVALFVTGAGMNACSHEFEFFTDVTETENVDVPGTMGGRNASTEAASKTDGGASGDDNVIEQASGGYNSTVETAGFGDFSTPTLLNIETVAGQADDDPSFTEDLLELYFSSTRSGAESIWVTKRPTVDAPWGTPQLLPSNINNTVRNSMPGISSDGLTLHFIRWGDDVELSSLEIYVATRSSRSEPFADPVPTGIEEGNSKTSPCTTADGLFIVWGQGYPGASAEIFSSSRPSATSPWGPVTVVSEVGSVESESEPWVSSDRLHLFFRSFAGETADILHSSRASRADPFSPPLPIDELNSTATDGDPWLNQAMTTIIFSSDRSGQMRLYESHREALGQ